VRRDAQVARGRRKGARPETGTTPAADATPKAAATPQQVIFPACPDKGRRSTRALRYRTGAPLPRAALRNLDRVYKTRWPCNENPIKALVAVGFDRNLDRGLTPTNDKGARMATGAEPLCKYLMLLMYNTLALLLWRSPLPEVQAMTPLRVYALLLGRSMLVCLDQRGWTLWIDPVHHSADRPLQEELVRLFNEQSLSIRGHRLYLRLHDPPG
jgi:hypothetical protein